MKDRLKRVRVHDGCTRCTIRFCWFLTPALAIQVFPTGLLPTLGALCGVGVPRALRDRRVFDFPRRRKGLFQDKERAERLWL